jgi:hypothetical protein
MQYSMVNTICGGVYDPSNQHWVRLNDIQSMIDKERNDIVQLEIEIKQHTDANNSKHRGSGADVFGDLENFIARRVGAGRGTYETPVATTTTGTSGGHHCPASTAAAAAAIVSTAGRVRNRHAAPKNDVLLSSSSSDDDNDDEE